MASGQESLRNLQSQAVNTLTLALRNFSSLFIAMATKQQRFSRVGERATGSIGAQSQAAESTLADDQPGAFADPRARRTRLSDSQATVGFCQSEILRLAKNLARAQTMFALAKLYQFRRELLQTELSAGCDPNRANRKPPPPLATDQRPLAPLSTEPLSLSGQAVVA